MRNGGRRRWCPRFSLGFSHGRLLCSQIWRGWNWCMIKVGLYHAIEGFVKGVLRQIWWDTTRCEEVTSREFRWWIFLILEDLRLTFVCDMIWLRLRQSLSQWDWLKGLHICRHLETNFCLMATVISEKTVCVDCWSQKFLINGSRESLKHLHIILHKLKMPLDISVLQQEFLVYLWPHACLKRQQTGAGLYTNLQSQWMVI